MPCKSTLVHLRVFSQALSKCSEMPLLSKHIFYNAFVTVCTDFTQIDGKSLTHGPCGDPQVHTTMTLPLTPTTLNAVPHITQRTSKDMARLSGLQRDVLSLYRECLRALRDKPTVCFSACYILSHWLTSPGHSTAFPRVRKVFQINLFACRGSLTNVLY